METATQFIDHYVKAWNAHDVPALLGHFLEDAIYEDAAIGMAKTGHAAIGEFMNFFFDCYANVTYTCRDTFRTDDRIVWQWTLRANYVKTSHTGVVATGQAVTLNGASILMMQGDRCAHNIDYWNYASMAQQIGAS